MHMQGPYFTQQTFVVIMFKSEVGWICIIKQLQRKNIIQTAVDKTAFILSQIYIYTKIVGTYI